MITIDELKELFTAVFGQEIDVSKLDEALAAAKNFVSSKA